MYAPVGRRWTLATIRWWGGWAEGEHRDTLIRYLLDELYYYEEGHGDTLRPIKTESHLSFLGKHRDQQPVTNLDMRTIFASMQETITTRVVSGMSSIITNVLEDDSRLSDILNILKNSNINRSTISNNIIIRKGEYSCQVSSYSSAVAAGQMVTRPSQPDQTSTAIPPRLSIPNVLQSDELPTANRWKIYIQQWNPADPGNGLYFTLKDWEIGWIKHPAFAMKYHDRKVVVQEFERCGKDEKAFVARWPASSRGIGPLMTAIRQARIAQGESKPRQRKCLNKKLALATKMLHS